MRSKLSCARSSDGGDAASEAGCGLSVLFSSAFIVGANVHQQRIRLNLEAVGYADEDFQTRIFLRSLDPTDVAHINASAVGEVFLGHAGLFAQTAYVFSQPFFPVHMRCHPAIDALAALWTRNYSSCFVRRLMVAGD